MRALQGGFVKSTNWQQWLLTALANSTSYDAIIGYNMQMQLSIQYWP